MAIVLLVSVFVISTCGLVYELIAGTLASYLLGDSVTQFSTVIGVYLFSMGIGSYLSKFIHKNLASIFIQVELLVALVGGTSATFLFILFEHVAYFRVFLYSMVSITGVLVGLEIPILMRMLRNHFEFKDLVSKIFTFDYIGALLASLLFPLFLVPHLGLIRSAFLFGIINAAVALWTLHLFQSEIRWVRLLKISALGVLTGLTLGFIFSEQLLSFAEASHYPDRVIYSKTTAYQRIILTKSSHDLRLFLNGNLQFSSRDEYRYHESLVQPAFFAYSALKQPLAAQRKARCPKRVLILGGGDGMAVREILKHPDVESVDLIDLDSEMTRLFSTHPALVDLNQHSLLSKKVRIFNEDAFQWLKTKKGKDQYDLIVVDFPDPSNYSLGKLYTASFYKEMGLLLDGHGIVVIQSTSPFVARKSFWCVEKTLRESGLNTMPYHAYVPSFGEWGFLLAAKGELPTPQRLKEATPVVGHRFIVRETIAALFQFPPDMRKVEAPINRLNNQTLVRIFDEEWSDYLQSL